MSMYSSNTVKIALRTAVVAGLVGGLLLTQHAFAAASHRAGAPMVSSPAGRTLNVAAVSATKVKRVSSNVSQLKELGIQINEPVLIDVADDGRNRYLNVGAGGAVNFTGTRRSADDGKMMMLKPAKVVKKAKPAKNRVVIAPPFYNEDLGTGSCVADIKKGVLRLATCKAGAANQTWHVIPAGDSGQFELHGAHTKIRVNKGKITNGTKGYVGLQTLDFK